MLGTFATIILAYGFHSRVPCIPPPSTAGRAIMPCFLTLCIEGGSWVHGAHQKHAQAANKTGASTRQQAIPGAHSWAHHTSQWAQLVLPAHQRHPLHNGSHLVLKLGSAGAHSWRDPKPTPFMTCHGQRAAKQTPSTIGRDACTPSCIMMNPSARW